MNTRKQKIEELMESFQALRRSMAFHPVQSGKLPRITPSQWGVLMLIGHRGKSTVKEVADSLGVTSSATTQLIDGLVASGYVVREESAEDRRSVSLTLSSKTKKHIKQIKGQVLQKFIAMFEVLNDREFDQYIELNKKILNNVKQK